MFQNVTRLRTMKSDELKRIRDRLQMTQEELAKRLGVSRLSVLRWENGQSDISKSMAIAIRSIAKEERAA